MINAKRSCFNYDNETKKCIGLDESDCKECKFYKHVLDPINNKKMEEYRKNLVYKGVNNNGTK